MWTGHSRQANWEAFQNLSDTDMMLMFIEEFVYFACFVAEQKEQETHELFLQNPAPGSN